MPLVMIETRRGLPPETKRQMFDAVHAALMAAFKIPDGDRGQRLLEYAPQDFEIPPGRGERFTIVSIEAFAGRSLDAKRALYQEIVTRFEAAGIPKTDVFIVLKEVPVENWGLRGGIAACDLDLGFKVAV
jgi:phenylpyruvate tautomerase PptA (4-oxalocrotonate tautomerase family)